MAKTRKLAFQFELPEKQAKNLLDLLSHAKLMVKTDEGYAEFKFGPSGSFASPVAPPPKKEPNSHFGMLMDVFLEEGVVVTERPQKLIGLVNARASKLKSPRVVMVAYCRDEFCRKAGLSINGFLNNMDRIASRLSTGKRAPEREKTAAEQIYKGPRTTTEPVEGDEETIQATLARLKKEADKIKKGIKKNGA